MRVQKLVVIFIVVAFSGSIGFAENTSPKGKGSEEFFRQNSASSVQLAQNSNTSDDVLTEALRQKQAELDAAENKPAPKAPAKVRKPAQVQPEIAKPVAQPKPIAQPKAPEIRPVPAPVAPAAPAVAQPSVSPASDDVLSEALQRKQAELDAQEAARTSTAKIAKTAKPENAIKTPAMQRAEEKEREQSEKRIKKIEAEILAKEETIQKKLAKTGSAPAPAEVEANRESRKKADAMNAALQAKTGSKTVKSKNQLVSPPVEVSGKEAKLAELLRKYKADEITPHDYHLERAKIIAEP
jgi:hypothetical protein